MGRRHKKKSLQKSPHRDVRGVPARAVAPRSAHDSGAPGVGYPTAMDLIAAPQWREFLQGALRSVLRPAALAGAVGLAGIGAGCGGDGGVIPQVAALFAEDPTAGATGTPTVVFQPIPNGVSLPPPPVPVAPTSTWVTVTPIPPGTQVEPPCPLPPPPSVTHPPRNIPPSHNPAHLRGRIAPVRPVPPPPPPPIVVPTHANPPQIRGDIAMVMPDPVPVPLGGAPMQVQLGNDPGDSADGS